MFELSSLDERGEIPVPFCVEKHNFNPFSLKGEFDLDKQGRLMVVKNKNGELVDKKGLRVNKRGWLIDNNGSVCDRGLKKKFDKKLLTTDGDLPKLFNYNGRRFDVIDLCGVFERDIKGGIVL